MRYEVGLDLVAYKAIALAGIDRAAWETLGISDSTFYKWMSRHESFRDAVARAKEFHRKSSPEALRLALIAYVVQTLENGGDRVRVQQTTFTRTTRRDRQNRIVFVDEVETTTEVQEYRGLPKWIADKIMGNASGINEAIAKVIAAGYDVSEPQLLLNGHSHPEN